ncbi:MAG: hypothetical protein IJX37_05735 [Oscillospiraceae bacterium]|nr:hypothetical protein [Oscillospiraceae bacterium]
MSPQQRAKKFSLRMLIFLWLLIILLSLLTVATYTWFALSRTPRVSDMNMYVNAGTGLQIALSYDSQEWGQQLDFLDMSDETAPLRPVTWSEKDQRFYAAVYGIDGRLTGQWEPLTDKRNANKDNADGYYCMGTLYARSDMPVNVSLAKAAASANGHEGHGTYLIGTPLWNEETISHDNGGVSAQCAVRIGIRITHIDENGNPTQKPSAFYIYEPNADSHIDGTQGYTPTPSIDGTDSLVEADKLITQTTTTWTEAYPVERDVLIYEMGAFTGDTKLFSLEAGEMAKLELYIWLEGQDVDCTNQIRQAQILANIQFTTEAGGHSGMKPIA